MTDPRARSSGLDAVEARNALAAEGFRKLPDDVETWRLREVLTKLGRELGLSSGAVLYAIDLIGLLTEADWRGDGRAVTFHSVRTYARKVGKSERTICEYERQLVAAGLVHRTVKHARRHGGQGNELRRTGLDWRAFGVAMPAFLERLARRQAMEERRLDLEARIRTMRHMVLGLIEGLEEGRAAAFLEAYAALGIARLRGTLSVAELEERNRRLTVFHLTVIDAVENSAGSPQTAIQSEEVGGPIDDTLIHQSPTEIRRDRSERIGSGHWRTAARSGKCDCSGKRSPGYEDPPRPNDATSATGRMSGRSRMPDAIPLGDIWDAVPCHWKDALGPDTTISWPTLIELAGHMASGLGVDDRVWRKALEVIGPCDAALALVVLDRNRHHPKTPVLSVGGALVGMTRNAERGDFNLAPSVYGMLARVSGRARIRPARNGEFRSPPSDPMARHSAAPSKGTDQGDIRPERCMADR